MNTSEKGRSMVEMLGVLAIIGVLSIGGIAGYTLAINNYKANQILDIAGKLMIAYDAVEAAPGYDRNISFNRIVWDGLGLDIEDGSLYSEEYESVLAYNGRGVNVTPSRPGVLRALKSKLGVTHNRNSVLIPKNM